MDTLHAEVAIQQLCKAGEELCGDTVEIARTPLDTIIVLSDGLGSGVKANILATMTTKIVSSMLKKTIPLKDVVETVTATLPVCKVRKIAYSTFSIISIRNTGETKIAEFDAPPTFLKRANKVVPFPTTESVVGGKKVRVGHLFLQEGDMLTVVSDGIIYAGIGGLLKLGWGWEGIASHLEEQREENPDKICKNLIHCTRGYYLDHAGDDATAVVIKMRRPIHLTVLAGPPTDPSYDERVVKRFFASPGGKVICGGSTANMVSRCSQRRLLVDLVYHDPGLPPTGKMEGVDLVTEGILTLNAALDRLRQKTDLNDRQDGASRLARLLQQADRINILAGSAVNPAHQNPDFPTRINIKMQVLNQLVRLLRKQDKEVEIETI